MTDEDTAINIWKVITMCKLEAYLIDVIQLNRIVTRN